MKLPVLLVFSAFLSGCATLPVGKQSAPPIYTCETMLPPLLEDFYRIYREPYVENLYDCSNKSAKYTLKLRENGFEANTILIEQVGYVVGDFIHAVVIIKIGDDCEFFCDITNGTWTTDLPTLGIPLAYVNSIDLLTNYEYVNNLHLIPFLGEVIKVRANGVLYIDIAVPVVLAPK
jgi:hypothetical protein